MDQTAGSTFPTQSRPEKNPLFTYSHKQCLDATVDIAAILDDKLYTRLLLTGGGLFRDLITRGAFILYLELTSNIDADASLASRSRNRFRRESILRDAQRIAQYAKGRMLHGETNIKGYVFISMSTAQLEALFEGSSPEEAAMKAARESLEMCRGILEAMAMVAITEARRRHLRACQEENRVLNCHRSRLEAVMSVFEA